MRHDAASASCCVQGKAMPLAGAASEQGSVAFYGWNAEQLELKHPRGDSFESYPPDTVRSLPGHNLYPRKVDEL